MAAFIFENGVISAEELAQAINNEMQGQDKEVRGSGCCLKVDKRFVAFIHEKTVPPAVIFVDKDENLPFIEAAREIIFLREFEGIE